MLNLMKDNSTGKNAFENTIKRIFKFYLLIGILITSFFFVISQYTNAVSSMFPFMIVILSISLNFLMIKDCFTNLLDLEIKDNKTQLNRDV